MKKIRWKTELEVFDSISELPETVRPIIDKAHKAREQAYAPYSRFGVGAAILLDNGTIVTGNNQENAAFPSGLCAERVAAYYAGARFPGATFKILAITAGSMDQINDQPIPPCGACRQALAEYEKNQGSPMEIYFMGQEGVVVKAPNMESLLPFIFDSSYL